MKSIISFLLLCLITVSVQSQRIYKVTLTKDGQVESISFAIDNGVIINMDKTGAIKEWGTEVFSDRNQNLTRLDKYLGRVEYFADHENEAFRGKVKYIGMTAISYYGTYDREELQGKVRSIGRTIFQYYQKSENEYVQGYLKTAGSVGFDWYNSFDNEALRGKLKMLGNTALTYYASFDDVAIRGKLKSIDRFNYQYYTSNERREWAGSIKSGAQQQIINGVKYFVNF